jgi:pyruvate dehydrogenase E2 component (dihydrolipoamide acetyltransferase)
MNVDFKLPELGENVTSGDVVSVLVREGDVIAANDGVLELETEKAIVEIPCPHAGKIRKVHVAKGQTVKVGQTVLSIESEEAAKPPTPAAGTKPRPAVAPETEKTVKQPAATETAKLPLAASQPAGVAPAGPEVRRVAREMGVDLAEIEGTGKGGRITVDDVRAAAAAVTAKAPAFELPPALEGIAPQPGTREPAVPPGELGQDTFGPVRRERMSKIRRTIAAQMAKSASTIPHVTNFDDADVTDLERMRKTVPPAYLGPAVKLTAMPFVLKAVALALRQHPMLNASIDEEKQEIVYKQYVNLGVAVDTPRGLIVPVIRNIDQMGILHIARELTVLAARARSAEFGMDELRGGTFTISNLGAVGGTYSTPIINHPEVAILLLGRSRWVLAVHEGKIEGRLMMPLSLSYDHRLVDGAAAGRFLNDVIGYLQAPGKLLLTK